ncbi:MAG TPA: hypothetical protein DEH10_12960 [Pseudomonas sp.]|nr:hypothetical protein [Pseudomonas sp.]
MSVYLTLVMSLMLVFAPISSELSDIYDPDMSIENYEKLLRFYIWGGRESYIQRRDLKNAALEFTGQKKAELELPGWAKFIELSRNLLNAPAEISSTLIPCRELAMRFLSDNDVEIDKHLRARLKTSNRTKQFMTAASDYLVSATGLPKDLHTRLTTAISELT